MKRVIEKVQSLIESRPDLKHDAVEIYLLMKDEIESGESEENEIELALDALSEIEKRN